MTRTTKANDIPHNDPEAAALASDPRFPKFFGKNGFVDTAPSKTKKDGGGKGNWGHPGDELEELHGEFNMNRSRRWSNTSPTQLKSKFEFREEEVLYDEERHGPVAEEHVTTTNGTAVESPAANVGPAAGSTESGEALRA